MNHVNLIIPDTFGRAEVSARPGIVFPGHLSGNTMGTGWSAVWYTSAANSEPAILAAFEMCFARIISSMSTWETDSLISRFNQLDASEQIGIDAAFAGVLHLALDVAERSDGAFDPCLGAAIARNGFGGGGVRTDAEAASAGPAAWGAIRRGSGVLIQPGGVVLDLSAIAKGYAVDEMARTLSDLGISQFLVEIGGEYVGRGVKPDGMPWWVDVENPANEGGPWRIALCGAALATSGDYRQSHVIDGRTVSHIVPHAGRVCEGGDVASVSVLHHSCALADAWATALFAAGDVAGLRMAEQEGLAALFQYRDAPPRLSRSLANWLS